MTELCLKTLVLLACIISFSIVLILNLLYRSQLFVHGVNFIIQYQSKQQNKVINVIQNLISILGNTFFIVALVALVHLVSYRKLNTFVYIFYIIVNAYFITIEKQSFQDGRPFFYSSQVHTIQWTCPKSFGFPSGHSWVSILLYQILITDFLGTEGYKKIFQVIPLLTGILIPLSRQYLGSHTADQVVNGVFHSFLSVVLYRFIFRNEIYVLLMMCTRASNRTIVFCFNTLFYALAIAISYVVYGINVNNRTPFDSGMLNNLNSACDKNSTQLDLEKQAGKAGAVIGLIFGLVYGLLLSGSQKVRKIFEIQNRASLDNIFLYYLKGQWTFNTATNVGKYIFFYIIFGGILVGGIGFGVSSAISNFYVSYIIQSFAYCLFGISMTCFIPLLLIKTQSIYKQQKQPINTGEQLNVIIKTKENYQANSS